LRHDPGLPKTDVAERAGVSVRTVERILGAARNTTTV
jgi:DNA-binding LacI/PurR family transcriptional regulator